MGPAPGVGIGAPKTPNINKFSPGRGGEGFQSLEPRGNASSDVLQNADPVPAREPKLEGCSATLWPVTKKFQWTGQGIKFLKKFRFGLEWPPAASGPQTSTMNRIFGRLFSSFIKFHCNRTIFDPFFGSGGRGAHVCYSLPSPRGSPPRKAGGSGLGLGKL